MVTRIALLWLLALAYCGCANRPLPNTTAAGWHDCGGGWGCPAYWICVPHRACEYWGEIDGPGPADAAKDSSGVNTPDR